MKIKSLAFAVSVFAVAGAPAIAQDRLALEEVVVTGVLKQDSSLLETPLSVTAMDSDTLERRGINSLADLVDGQVPSARVQPYANNPSTISIGLRGLIAADAGSVGVEAPVAVNVDGVYLGRMQGLSVDMVELERLEVLRGPQGTLFGRNAIGGVVNLISKKPTGELGFSQRLTVGSDYGELRSLTRVDLPETAGVSARISGLFRVYDGYVENPDQATDGLYGPREQEDFSKNDQTAFRLALRWEGERVSADYSLDIASLENSQAYFQASNTLSRVGITPELLAYCGGSENTITEGGSLVGTSLFTPDPARYAQCQVIQGTLAGLALTQGVAGPSNLPPAILPVFNAPSLGGGSFDRTLNIAVLGGATSATLIAGAASRIPGLAAPTQNDILAAIGAYAGMFAGTSAAAVGAYIPNGRVGEQGGRQDKARDPLYLAANATDHTAHVLTLNFDLGEQLALRSITAFRELEEELNNNYNGSLTGLGVSGSGGGTRIVGGMLVVDGAESDFTDQNQLSQELQLSGSFADGRIDFIAGLYYFNESVEEAQGTFHSVYEFVDVGRVEGVLTPYPIVLPLLTADGSVQSLAVPVCLTCEYSTGNTLAASSTASFFNSSVEFDATSLAFYGQFTYALNDRWDLTFGLRQTQDEREGLSLVSNSAAPSTDRAVFNPTVDDSHTDFALIGSYKVDDLNTVYGRFATGYKAGGISRRAISFNVFEQETLTSIEVGYKGRLLDNRLAINAAAFMMAHKDKQVSLREVFFRRDATVANTLGANFSGTTDITGLELELMLLPLEGLRLGLDLTLLNWSVPDQDEDALCPASIVATEGECTPGDAAGVFPSEFFLPQAPDMAVSFSVDYAFAPFSFGTLDFHLDANMSGDYHPNPTDAELDGYTIINARVALRDISLGTGALDVALWSRNLADEEYFLITTGAAAVYNAPATFGLDLIYEF